MKKNILIVAGEASGDLHAAELIKALKKQAPQLHFFGLGGQRMKDVGVDIESNIVKLAVVGFFEVIKNLGKFLKIFKSLLEKVDQVHPDLAILVDYPGFNLKLAKELKKRNIPVIYYISPQVWAWGKKRIKTIKELVTRMLVFFKFEEELYNSEGVAVTLIGHPLLDSVKPSLDKEEIVDKYRLPSNQYVVSILPGSRIKEVKTHLPIMLKAAKIIYKELGNNVQFLILRSSTVKEGIYNRIMLDYQLPANTLTDMTYDALSISSSAMVASGTATLETAILEVPMAVIYKISFFTWAYIRTIIKLPYIGLVNIVAREKIVPEFLQYQASPKKIAAFIMKTLTEKEYAEKIKKQLYKLKSLLGEPNAAPKAAETIIEHLK